MIAVAHYYVNQRKNIQINMLSPMKYRKWKMTAISDETAQSFTTFLWKNNKRKEKAGMQTIQIIIEYKINAIHHLSLLCDVC